MSLAISKKTAEIAMPIVAALQTGDHRTVLGATNTAELSFAEMIDQATPSERLGILGICYYAYQSIGEWELAALKIEDAICFAEKHQRNSPETAGDYADLAEAYLGLGDTGAAVRAMEIAIEQMTATSKWQEFGPRYERRIGEMRDEHARRGGRPALRRPELLRCPEARVATAQVELGAALGLNAEGYPKEDPRFDPIYVVVWQLSRLPTAEEASTIVSGFVSNGELPEPDKRTRFLRMSDTAEWSDASALTFQIAVHRQLKRSFPEVSRYIRVSDTGFERDERIDMATVTGVATIGNPPSAPMNFRVVDVRPRAPSKQTPQPGAPGGKLSRSLKTVLAKHPEPREVKPKKQLLAVFVLRQGTSPTQSEAGDIARRCLQAHYGEEADWLSRSPALIAVEKGGRLWSTSLERGGDVRELMSGYIRLSGNEQLLEFPTHYDLVYRVIETGDPPETTCIALCFGPDVEEFDPGLVDVAGFAASRGDHHEAARLLRRAAEQGIARGQYNLGVLLYEGRGVQKDFDEATRWFQKAADQNYANAVYMLAFMHEHGFGCERDLAEAFRLYQRGAELGEEDSQLKVAYLQLSARLQALVGVSYRKEGWDFVAVNEVDAIRHLRALREAGDERASESLRAIGSR